MLICILPNYPFFFLAITMLTVKKKVRDTSEICIIIIIIYNYNYNYNYKLYIYGTVHAKMITRFYIYNVIKFPYV